MKAGPAGGFIAKLIFVVGGILNWHYVSSGKQKNNSGQGREDNHAHRLGDFHPQMPILR